jgi:pseudaminic acid synthase
MKSKNNLLKRLIKSNQCFIIAEISGNHNGNKKLFLNLIKSAYKNGADMVKIQTYEPKDITLNNRSSQFRIKKGIWKNKYLWDLYKKAHTPYNWHHDAFKIAKKNKKILFSSPFSLKAVDFLEKFNVPLYKIASFEITDLKLVDYIAKKRKPIIMSTGMSSYKEVDKAIKIIEKYHTKIIILHCVSGYPTKLENTNLKKFQEIQKKYKKYLVGISDHTNGITSSIASFIMGAKIIEKHYKIDNRLTTTDSEFSITPAQLRELKNKINNLWFSITQKNSDKTENNSKKLRRSIFVTKRIKINEKITNKNIDTLRPKIGICASKYFEVLGKKAKKNINPGTPLKKNMLF